MDDTTWCNCLRISQKAFKCHENKKYINIQGISKYNFEIKVVFLIFTYL